MSETWRYVNIPGMGPSFLGTGGVESLYLAPDHLLVLHRAGSTESARRFYYKDIQAIRCFKTNQGIYVNVVFTAMVLLLVALAFAVPLSDLSLALWVPCIILGGVFLVCLVLNAIRGATCVTTLHTAVNALQLHSLRRMPKARRGIDRIVERVRAAQEPIDPARVAAILEERAQGASPRLPVTRYALPAVRVRPREREWYGTATAHAWFFGLLALMALSSVLDYYMDNDIKNFFDSFLMLSILAVGVVAVIRQRNSNLGRAVRTASAVSLGIQIVFFNVVANLAVMGGVMMSVIAAQQATDPFSWDEVPDWFRLIYVTMTLVGCGSCALWGLLALRFTPRTGESPEMAKAPAA